MGLLDGATFGDGGDTSVVAAGLVAAGGCVAAAGVVVGGGIIIGNTANATTGPCASVRITRKLTKAKMEAQNIEAILFG